MFLRYEKEISLILKSIFFFLNQGFRFINRIHFLAISLLRYKRKFNWFWNRKKYQGFWFIIRVRSGSLINTHLIIKTTWSVYYLGRGGVSIRGKGLVKTMVSRIVSRNLPFNQIWECAVHIGFSWIICIFVVWHASEFIPPLAQNRTLPRHEVSAVITSKPLRTCRTTVGLSPWGWCPLKTWGCPGWAYHVGILQYHVILPNNSCVVCWWS